jgi:HlyD family secretion protein
VGRLKAEQKVAFTVNAYPNRSFEGVVRMVRLSAQTVQNVVTYTAVISVRNRDQALLPGMTANLQIVTDDREDVLRVPNAALRFRPAAAPNPPAIGSAAAEGLNPRRNRGQDAPQAAGEGSEGRVYRVGQDGNPQPVPLRLGVTDGAFTEVLRGDLPEGAALVVGGGPRAGAAADANAPASGTRRPPRMF